MIEKKKKKVIRGRGNTSKKRKRFQRLQQHINFEGCGNKSKAKPLVRLLKSPIMKQGANGGHKVKTKKPFMKLL